MQGAVPNIIAGFYFPGGTIRTMSAPEIRFGTEGWRGVIADDFTVANVRLVAHALARHLKEAQPPGEGVLVAYDCRAVGGVCAGGGAGAGQLRVPCVPCAAPRVVARRGARGHQARHAGRGDVHRQP